MDAHTEFLNPIEKYLHTENPLTLACHFVFQLQVGGGTTINELLEQSLEGALVFALVWGSAGSLSTADRLAFDVAFRSLHSGRLDNLEKMGLLPPESLAHSVNDSSASQEKRNGRFSQHLPPTGSCFEIFWDFQQRKWLSWSLNSTFPDVRRTITASALQHVLVETPETAFIDYFIHLVCDHGRAHLLLAGELGGGKSKCTLQLIQRMLVAGDKPKHHLQVREKAASQQKVLPSVGNSIMGPEASPNDSKGGNHAFALMSISLTGATSPKKLQQWLEGRLERNHKGGFNVPNFHRGILLLDDVHLPSTEEFGAQPTGELLRQLLDRRGWTQRGTWRFCSVEGLSVLATSRAVRQQHQQLSERLTRLFIPVISAPYSPESLQFILSQLLLLRFHKSSEAVVDSLHNVALLTVRLYKELQKRLPPRPARWTYHWTVRDTWRLVQRMAALDPVGLESRHTVLCCWLHEARRVFEDRIAAAADLEAFSNTVADILKDTACVSLTDLHPPGEGPLLFAFQDTPSGSIARPVDDCILGSRVYARITASQAQILCASGLEQYSLLHPKSLLSFVLFPQAVQLTLRCMNTFLQPQGHALLLGVGGSGRRSACRLAASLAGFETVEPHGAPSSVGITEWQEDLKAVILATGALGRPQLLMIQGEHLAREEIASDICSLLLLQELPEVLTADEKVCNSLCFIKSTKQTQR